MSLKCKIKKGDTVIVLSGSDKGKVGKVLQLLPKDNKVLVAGANILYKHRKPKKDVPGGIDKKEAYIHISNVAFQDFESSKPSKLGVKTSDNGSRVRFIKRTGRVLNNTGGA